MTVWFEVAASVAHVAAVVALVWSILTFAADRRAQAETKEFEAFTRLLEFYQHVSGGRKMRWSKIKKTLRKNPKTAAEVHDRQDTLSYLELRSTQQEPLFPVEHSLLEDEIQSLNLVNELCRVALGNERSQRILAVAAASEVSYYQNRLSLLQRLYEREKVQRLFPIPQSDALERVDISRRFDQAPGPARGAVNSEGVKNAT